MVCSVPCQALWCEPGVSAAWEAEAESGRGLGGQCCPRTHSLTRCPLQEGVTSQTSHWSRLYFMTFYIVTMVGPATAILTPTPTPGCRVREEGPHLTGLQPPQCLSLWPGGDDHHRGLHPGGLCLPHELQPQEPGHGRCVRVTPRALAAPLAICPAGHLSRWLSTVSKCITSSLHPFTLRGRGCGRSHPSSPQPCTDRPGHTKSQDRGTASPVRQRHGSL